MSVFTDDDWETGGVQAIQPTDNEIVIFEGDDPTDALDSGRWINAEVDTLPDPYDDADPDPVQ